MKQEFFAKIKNGNMIMVLSMILSVAIMVLVYMTGGTPNVYAHLMYIPIAIIASVYGKKKGLIMAIVGGLLVGPFMPFDATGNSYQHPFEWTMRLLMFVVVAIIIGVFSDYDRLNKKRILAILTHNESTGLKNIEAIKNEIDINGIPRTIAVFSIKGFQDTMILFGYIFENEIINEIVEKLNKILEQYDCAEIYQYYGMQFMLKITNEDEDGYVKADEIIKAIKDLDRTILVADNIPIYLEVRMGYTQLDENGSTYEGVRQALIAYSYAKANALKEQKFDKELEEFYKNILNIAGGFSEAISSQKIGAAYQKIVKAVDESIYSVELLARWKKTNGEFISPDLFIPIVEKTELIHELTKYMITRAIELLKLYENENWVVSINFSKKDFSNEIIDFLIDIIDKSQVDSSRIQIEVIERNLADINNLHIYMDRLRNHKIRIALDDFGTGYSSYQYLCELPIDTVKIDKSLICNIDKSATSKSLVDSIVKFCSYNEIRTVAEGVETKEIAEICKEIGIDYLQGYYYYRPEMFEN